MAQAEVVQGTGAELQPYIDRHRDQDGLTLIIPNQQEAISQTQEPAIDWTQPQPGDVVKEDGTIVRNGVPLFPRRPGSPVITSEMVYELLREDDEW